MANLTPSSTFSDVYQLERGNKIDAGLSGVGISNLQAKQLLNRTEWLKDNNVVLNTAPSNRFEITTATTANYIDLSSLVLPSSKLVLLNLDISPVTVTTGTGFIMFSSETSFFQWEANCFTIQNVPNDGEYGTSLTAVMSSDKKLYYKSATDLFDIIVHVMANW